MSNLYEIMAKINETTVTETKFKPREAANVKPTKNGMKSSGLSTICFNKIAIPTQGSKAPTVNKVFIGIPSIGNAVFNAVTALDPKMCHE